MFNEMFESTSMREELEQELAGKQRPINDALRNVKRKIAILSSKGGMGKTSTVVNMASVLKNMGNKVGIIDANVHGPSIPKLTGINKRTDQHEARQKSALETEHGIKVMSVSLFGPGEATPIMWKGHYKARVRQLLASVNWGPLEYLLVDVPPGTGDEFTTIIKSIPGLDGVVLETTPQDVSISVSKAIDRANEIKVPVLGLIESMSDFICPHCGESVSILGEGKGEELARTYRIPFLGRVPLDQFAGKAADKGVPVVEMYPDSPSAIAFMACTVKLLGILKNRNGALG